MKTDSEFEWDAKQRLALDAVVAGKSVLLRGPAGSGRTTLALEVARERLSSEALNSKTQGSETQSWAPALVLTPDRQRATRLDRRLSSLLGGAGSADLTAPGSHRLVRSLDSFAYLVVSTWLVEREEPKARPTLTSGAREDGWVARFLHEHADEWEDHFSEAVLESPRFRMEIRNLIARSGQAGLAPEDLLWLGEETSLPMWQLAGNVYAAYAGGEKAFTVNTPYFDSARLPLIAAKVLAKWDEERGRAGVTAPKPVPSVVVVDDVQDMPLSAVPLLHELQNAGAQIFATWSPDAATAQHRGATHHTGVRLAKDTNSVLVDLTEDHGLSREVWDLAAQVASWIPKPRLPQEAEVLEDEPTLQPAPAEGSVSRVLAPTRSRMETQVERFLRLKNLEGVAWEDMAVLVRTGDEVTSIRQALARQGVPLESGDRPVVLSKVPVCSALLHLLADPLDASDVLEETGFDPDQSALDLLLSPLVGADPLDVYRALRGFRRSRGDRGLFLTDLLEGSPEPIYGVDQKVSQQIKTAHKLWKMRGEARALSAQDALWSLWSTAGIGSDLAARALEGRDESANDTLDAVLALFRKADFWEQEQTDLGHPIHGSLFATEILGQQVQTDPLVPNGLHSHGVSVTTPSQAVGRRWKVVTVAGVQQGSWPRAAHDGLGQVGRLQEVLDDARQRGWEEEQRFQDFLPKGLPLGRSGSFQAESRVDEARLFYAAATRASEDLRLFSVNNEDELPSVFLRLLTEAGVLNEVFEEDAEGDKSIPVFEELPASVGLHSKILELRRQALGNDGDEVLQRAAVSALALLAVEGETLADPAVWAPGGQVTQRQQLFGDRKVRLSPSRLDTADSCPLRWFLETSGAGDQDLTEDPHAFSHMQRGLIVHAIADEHPFGTHSELRAAFEKLWEEAGYDDETTWMKRHYEETGDMIDRLAAYYEALPPDIQVVTESDIDFEVGDAVVAGRVDRIEFKPEEKTGETLPHVVDIKTGKPPTAADAEKSLQLRAYQLGLKKMGHQSGGAALLSLQDGEKGRLRSQNALDEDAANEAEETLADLANRLKGPNLVADPENGDCRTCPFKWVCPAMPQSVRGVE